MRAHLPAAALLCLSSAVVLPAPAPPSPPVFRTRADLVRLDLLVRDKSGRLIEDLKPGEVQVFEDGQPCAVESFRLVRSKEPSAVEPPSDRSAPPVPATAPDDADRLQSVVVLVFDQLELDAARNARAAALELAGRPFPKGSMFAVYKIGQGLAVLQSFTADRAALPAAIERATTGVDRARDPSRRGVHENATEEAFAVAAKAREAEARGDPDGRFLQMEARMLLFSDRVSREAQGQASLQPLLSIAQGLSLVEGRKSVLYFSEGLTVPSAIESVFRAAVSAANRANTSVYAFDARGLRVRGPFEETREALGTARADAAGDLQGGDTREGSLAPEKSEDALRLNRQGVLRDLAESTGGFLVAESNDLRPGLEKVMADLRAYYDVGYAPPDPRPDGRWRAITVKVTRPGAVVRTRRGYYALPPGAPAVLPYELPLAEALAAAPPPHEVEHRAAILRFAGAAGASDVVVWVEVPLAGLSLARDETSYRGQASLLAVVKDEKGGTVARMSHDAPLEGPLADADPARQRTVVVKRALRLGPGRYVLETAVQDRESGKLGARRTSFEVPAPAGLDLGSVAIVRADEAGPAAADDAGDPLRTARVRATPLLGRSFREGTPVVSVLASLHGKAGEPSPVSVEIEVRRDGQTVARAQPELPAPDADGRITYVGSLPTGALRAGRYEVWFRARQGGAEAAEATAFTIAAPPGAGRVDAADATADSLQPGSIEDKPGAAVPLATILERAGRYVLEYENAFSNLVAEESYRQWGLDDPLYDRTGRPIARTLRSDLVFVRLPGPLPWGTFRDVYEVDGQKVRDRGRRLEKLFLSPKATEYEQAQAILDESSRYNLGRAYRNVNVPALGLLFLRPENQHRLAFKRKGTRAIAGFPTVEVAFQERKSPSLVHDRWGKDVPARGRFWIDETRGAVLRTEIDYDLETEKFLYPADSWEHGIVSTEYRRDVALGCVVPDTMTELYQFRKIGRVDAVARYSNYRRFDVSVGTAAALPITYGREAVAPEAGSAAGAAPPAPAPWPEPPASSPATAKPEAPPLAMVDAPAAPGAVASLLKKAGEYVVAYQQAFRDVAAEERYDQKTTMEANDPRVARFPDDGAHPGEHLRSEVVFAMLPGPMAFTLVRDVIEVDGRRLRSAGRLEPLFRASPEAGLREAGPIAAESERLILGPTTRTLTVPTMALGYLLPDNRDSFQYQRKATTRIRGEDAVEIEFREVARPTINHDGSGGDVPVRGSFWVRETDGAVLRSLTELSFGASDVPAIGASDAPAGTLTATAEYRLEPALGVLAPFEMTETLEWSARSTNPSGFAIPRSQPDVRSYAATPRIPLAVHGRIDGRATYSGFHRIDEGGAR